jgi:hypothetical protein
VLDSFKGTGTRRFVAGNRKNKLDSVHDQCQLPVLSQISQTITECACTITRMTVFFPPVSLQIRKWAPYQKKFSKSKILPSLGDSQRFSQRTQSFVWIVLFKENASKSSALLLKVKKQSEARSEEVHACVAGYSKEKEFSRREERFLTFYCYM